MMRDGSPKAMTPKWDALRMMTGRRTKNTLPRTYTDTANEQSKIIHTHTHTVTHAPEM